MTNICTLYLDNWNWVNSWADLLPLPTLVELLDQHFFPKWLKTLTMWINMNPNHEQISNWYTGWKSLMPAVIVEHPTIKGRFHSALDIMSRAVGGPSMPLPPPPPTIHVSGLYYTNPSKHHYNSCSVFICRVV